MNAQLPPQAATQSSSGNSSASKVRVVLLSLIAGVSLCYAFYHNGLLDFQPEEHPPRYTDYRIQQRPSSPVHIAAPAPPPELTPARRPSQGGQVRPSPQVENAIQQQELERALEANREWLRNRPLEDLKILKKALNDAQK